MLVTVAARSDYANESKYFATHHLGRALALERGKRRNCSGVESGGGAECSSCAQGRCQQGMHPSSLSVAPLPSHPPRTPSEVPSALLSFRKLSGLTWGEWSQFFKARTFGKEFLTSPLRLPETKSLFPPAGCGHACVYHVGIS